MEIPLEQVIAITAIFITIIGGIIAYCLRIESKFKDLENELKLLEPLKKILEQKGTEHVIRVFEERKP